jgi:hypothetical protein
MQRDIYGASVTFDPHAINNQTLHVLYWPLASLHLRVQPFGQELLPICVGLAA